MIKKYLSAVGFLTIFPVSNKGLKSSASFFPLAGLFVGGILVSVHFLCSFLFPKLVVDVLVIITLVFITGGLHLDGFADTLDGFYAGKNKNTILKIMDDVHIGAMGAIGIFCIIIIKFATIHAVPQKILYPALLLFPVLSRWSLVFACITFKPSKDEGLGKIFIDTVSKKDFLAATITAFLISIILFKLKGILILIATLFITLLFLRFVVKRINGITGDILGALNEICEIFVLLILCMK